MARLNAERDVLPELAVVNGRMNKTKLRLHETIDCWELCEVYSDKLVIKGTLREIFSFIQGMKYITEGDR